jgi:hypothetical protein
MKSFSGFLQSSNYLHALTISAGTFLCCNNILNGKYAYKYWARNLLLPTLVYYPKIHIETRNKNEEKPI